MHTSNRQSPKLSPLSVAQITRQASQYEFDPQVPLRYWLRSAALLVKEAKIYEQEGNDQQAYLLLFRHAQLILVNLLTHPGARDPSNQQGLKEAQRAVKNSLRELEFLKPRITRRYERYLQSSQDRESRSKSILAPGNDGAPSAATPTQDPALAGRPQPLAAAENRDLAVRLAQSEFRRRAFARTGAAYGGEIESSQLGKDEAGVYGPYHFDDGHTEPEDLARTLQKARAKVMSGYGREEVHDTTKNSAIDFPNPPLGQSPVIYKYPTIPPRSPLGSPLSPTPALPPVPQKITLPIATPKPIKPPDVPAKIFSDEPAPVLPYFAEPDGQRAGSSPYPKDLHPSTFTFKPSSYLENGKPLRTIFISPDLRVQFLKIAAPNTNNNLETCGMLCGTLISNALFISKLVIPEQESTPDTCEMLNESAMFDYCESEDLMVLGWIHTHPTQTCFMSSRDLHTQSGYQVMLPESIAIVCAPRHTPSWGVFRLTDPPGLKTVLQCDKPGLFHPHEGTHIYTDALRPGHVFEAKGLEFETVDLRPGGRK
ncbi:hypothetical protein FQN57_004454 [Myotisia sp. PD_48]|nr:hypothetical protein FQN57_004454 [Myotisia sp. PD_48]